MEIINDIEQMQARSAEWRKQGRVIGLVPTMGALHAGHRKLLSEARSQTDVVIMSLFVNPTQFDRAADLESYPKTFDADCAAAEAEGVEVVFAPNAPAMYPEGFQSSVEVTELSKTLCGATRAGHFGGVGTVVLKLFNITGPHKAFFGWKDAQQFLLLSRMVRDLNVAVEMIGVETVRESDGLALSSRNALLSDAERAIAPKIYQALTKLRDAAQNGEANAQALLAIARGEIEQAPGIEINYLEMVSIETLQPIEVVIPSGTMVAVAAFLGTTRLIDNVRF